MDLNAVGLYTELEGWATESCTSLQRELRERGLNISGVKAVLIQRLERNDAGASTTADKAKTAKAHTAAGLRSLLGAVGLSVSGNKEDLLLRWANHEKSLTVVEVDTGGLDLQDGVADELDMLEHLNNEDVADGSDNEADPELLLPDDMDGVDHENMRDF